jgi:hypothetical protein
MLSLVSIAGSGIEVVEKTIPKHPLDFHDHSLNEAVRDRGGKPIKYPPSDPRSKPVRDEIISEWWTGKSIRSMK